MNPDQTPTTDAEPPPAKKEGKCPDDPCGLVPWQVLVVALAWLLLLVAAFICYEKVPAFTSFVKFRIGRLPFETIWFGAVGGWLISANGIFFYNRKWKRSYDYWHYVRPVLGAIMGPVGCLIVVVLTEVASKESGELSTVFYDVVALAIGYREKSFRELIKKLVDTVILPGEKETKKA